MNLTGAQSLEVLSRELDPERPLLLVDADEVLLRFVDTLHDYFPTRGAKLGNRGFRLFGNVENIESGELLPDETIKGLLKDVWRDRATSMEAVPGAADALAALSKDWSIIILTNIPHNYAEARAENMVNVGMPYPVLSNADGKGPAVATLGKSVSHPLAFVDDLPPQHASVAKHAPECHRIHYVFHPEFASMIGPAEHAHVRKDTWAEIGTHLQNHLEEVRQD